MTLLTVGGVGVDPLSRADFSKPLMLIQSGSTRLSRVPSF